jgi:hypothetical protein
MNGLAEPNPFETLTGHEDQQVAELAALVLKVARVLPGKRNGWLKLAWHHRPLFNRPVLLGIESSLKTC